MVSSILLNFHAFLLSLRRSVINGEQKHVRSDWWKHYWFIDLERVPVYVFFILKGIVHSKMKIFAHLMLMSFEMWLSSVECNRRYFENQSAFLSIYWSPWPIKIVFYVPQKKKVSKSFPVCCNWLYMKFSAFYIKCMLLKITGRVLKIPGEKSCKQGGKTRKRQKYRWGGSWLHT